MTLHSNLEILDCTIRDGGYVNNWWFDTNVVRESYRALSKSGVDFVELGFRGRRDKFDPTVYGPWRVTPEDLLREAVDGIQGPHIAIMGNYGEIELDDLCNQSDSLATMVRIAAHKTQVFDAIDLLEKVRGKGYVTSLQAMAFGSYSDHEQRELKHVLDRTALDYFYIADSYGSMVPEAIGPLFEPFLDLEATKLGFHPHNNLQMAFANTLEAIRIGVDIVDSSIFGMGRGAGNLPTEALLAYLSTQGRTKYNVVPVLECIERFYAPIRDEHPWGYELPYMISGMFKCHPYYAAELVKRKEYSIEDIWKALEVIDELKPVGFDRSLVDKLVRNGVVGSLGKGAIDTPSKTDTADPAVGATPPSYVDRYAGRDFLILANGPGLKQYQAQIREFIDVHDPVVLGANQLSGLFVPDYHAFNNKHRFVMYHDSVHPKSNLLIGENIPGEMVAEYVNRDFEILAFRDVLDADFDIIGGRVQANCRTISVLLLGVALAMGARRLFVAGMDGYLGKATVTRALFYDEKLEPEDYDVVAERHQWNERFLTQIDQYMRDRGQEGLHIITPTSHHRFYKSMENFLQPCIA